MGCSRTLVQFWVDLFDGLGYDLLCDLELLDWADNTPCSPDGVEYNRQWSQYQEYRP